MLRKKILYSHSSHSFPLTFGSPTSTSFLHPNLKRERKIYYNQPNMATIYPLDVSANIRELKIHQIYDADVTKNYRYYHSFISRVKSMDGCW